MSAPLIAHSKALLTDLHTYKTLLCAINPPINNDTDADSELINTLSMIAAAARHVQILTQEHLNPKTKPPRKFETCEYVLPKNTDAQAEQPSLWSGFYNKTIRERMDVLHLMYPSVSRMLKNKDSDTKNDIGDLSVRTADLMIENCIGVLGLPLGLGLNFIIDGEKYSVPMAIEEPSVVAAASSAAKFVALNGNGFVTQSTGNIMTAQIQLVNTRDMKEAITRVSEEKERLLSLANEEFCTSMWKRGGGALDIYCRVVRERVCVNQSHWYVPSEDEIEIGASDSDTKYLIVHIDIDVCEAMGANVVNSVAEGLSDELCAITESMCGLRILTNLCTERRARSSFEIPISRLGWKNASGEQVAQKIIEAYNFAAIDPYRAVTNNKGIMNGIDSVAIATGQDWRAIEAGAHCYASRSGQYKSLSKYEIVRNSDNEQVLRGSLEIPIAVGSKGGALQTHPAYKITRAILGNPSARDLGAIIVSVGLAQNLAAIRAIAITGIQKGHMALHARNIAVAGGAPSQLVGEVCAYMLGRKCINVNTAKDYLQAHALYSEMWNSPPQSPVRSKPPSMLYVEIPVPHLDRNISLNIAFETLGNCPKYIAIKATNESMQMKGDMWVLYQQLFGDKGYSELERMFARLASMRCILTPEQAIHNFATRVNLQLQNTLQLLSVLMNILSYRLMELAPTCVGSFITNMLHYSSEEAGNITCRLLIRDLQMSHEVLCVGLSLLLALWQVLHYRVEQGVATLYLRTEILKEQRALLQALISSFQIVHAPQFVLEEQTLESAFQIYMQKHSKRWQATMLLLIDFLTIEPELLIQKHIYFLRDIGDLLEWKGTIAHDIARYKRATNEQEPNAFMFWLTKKKLDPSVGDRYVTEFVSFTKPFIDQKWEQLQSECVSKELFDLEMVYSLLHRIEDAYRV